MMLKAPAPADRFPGASHPKLEAKNPFVKKPNDMLGPKKGPLNKMFQKRGG